VAFVAPLRRICKAGDDFKIDPSRPQNICNPQGTDAGASSICSVTKIVRKRYQTTARARNVTIATCCSGVAFRLQYSIPVLELGDTGGLQRSYRPNLWSGAAMLENHSKATSRDLRLDWTCRIRMTVSKELCAIRGARNRTFSAQPRAKAVR
jgi:hypothetical protein